MSTGFQKATKTQSKARVALDGPSGSGKTWTSLVTARALAGKNGTVALIDSERGSASKYADRFDFDVLELAGNFHPDKYVEAIRLAGAEKYDVIIVDSLTHAWAGPGGVLEIVDAAKTQFGGNSYMAWSKGTPLYQRLVDTMLASPSHLVATMRSKSKYVETEKGNGKKSYERAGTEPVMRDGIEFEFDVVGDLDLDHNMVISKTRCPDLDSLYRKPGAEFGSALLAWLSDGAPAPEPTPPPEKRSRWLVQVEDSGLDEETLKEIVKGCGAKAPGAIQDDDALHERFLRAIAHRKSVDAALPPVPTEDIAKPEAEDEPPPSERIAAIAAKAQGEASS